MQPVARGLPSDKPSFVTRLTDNSDARVVTRVGCRRSGLEAQRNDPPRNVALCKGKRTAIAHEWRRSTIAYVDLGELGYYTLSENSAVTLSNSEGQEFRPGQWYRAAPWLDSDNSPGVSIVIGDTGSWPNRYGEAVWIDNNGNVNIALTILNVGTGTAAVGFQWLSAPELGE